MPPTERDRAPGPSGSVTADLQAGARDARAEVGAEEARRHRRQAGARRSGTPLGRDADDRRAGRARQAAAPSRKSEIEQGENAAAKFLIRWRGEADPSAVRALDTYWISAAEHGLNASTFTARIAASTGADCAAAMSSAVGTLSGPLHGGAPARVLPMIDRSPRAAIPSSTSATCSPAASGSWASATASIAPRTRVRACSGGRREELGSPRVEVALALEKAALAALREQLAGARRSRRTSSSGRRSCSTSPRSRRD